MSNETIADIVAQIRAVAHIQTADTPRSVLQFADRIEAAAKREEEHAIEHATKHAEAIARDNCRDCIYNPRSENYVRGNAEVMRKALEIAHNYFERNGTLRSDAARAVEAALASPPKNGDIGTAEEKLARWWEFCHKFEGCAGCPCDGHHNCFAKWTQMPYEEGGAE